MYHLIIESSIFCCLCNKILFKVFNQVIRVMNDNNENLKLE